jgi:hypothetical protein
MKPFNACTIICLIAISFSIASCKKEKKDKLAYDHFIFGRFYGMCAGEECIEIFKLEDGKLFEDTKDEYPNYQTFYNGNFVQLSDVQYQQTKDIFNFFPSDLLNETEIIIGSPDAGDWGGHYIEYNHNGTKRFWLLDKMKMNVNPKYHLFIDKLNEKIDSLK